MKCRWLNGCFSGSMPEKPQMWLGPRLDLSVPGKLILLDTLPLQCSSGRPNLPVMLVEYRRAAELLLG
jgi:hypothetical protein